MKNPEEKRHSWCRLNIARRLDYIFLSDTLCNFATDSYIKPLAFSDHNAVVCTCSFTPTIRGNSSYKLNVNLLKDKNYVSMIKMHLETIQGDQLYAEVDPHLKWELIKTEVRDISQQYSKFLCSNKRNENQMIYQTL